MAKIYNPSSERPYSIALQIESGTPFFYVQHYQEFTALKYSAASTTILKKIILETGYRLQMNDTDIVRYFQQDTLDKWNNLSVDNNPDTPPPTTKTSYLITFETPINLGNSSVFNAIKSRLPIGRRIGGWTIDKIDANGNLLNLYVTEMGTIPIAALAAVIAGMLILFFIYKTIAYTITKLSDNSVIKKNIDAINAATDALTNKEITTDEYNSALAAINATPDPSTPGTGTGDGIQIGDNTLLIAAAAIVAVLLLNKR